MGIIEWMAKAWDAVVMSWKVTWSEASNGYFYPDV